MGRYYHTNNHDGKFGFGCQSSDDPAYFGMEEQEPTTVDYYLEDNEENRQVIIDKLNENYDILGIAKEDRLYKIKESSLEIEALLKKYRDKNYHEFDKDNGIRISFGDGKSYAPRNKDIELAECRVWLGLEILDDLERDGYCDLNAEM